MNVLFRKLYALFLSGKISKEDFSDFKNIVNNLSDEELAETMHAYWMEHTEYPQMDKQRKQYIRKQLHKQIKPGMRKRYAFWARTAAAVAVVAVLSLTIWNISILKRENIAPFFAEVPAGNKVLLTLPDNSTVKLNSESTLSYVWENGKRTVKLTGEAFFNVQKDKKHPFIVEVGDVNIEVLGTNFNVRSEPGMVETSLVEGSISLYNKKYPDSHYIMKPMEKVVYANNKRTIYETDNVKETAWIHNHLVFDSEPLANVLKKIERWYGVKIQLMRPELASDRISGSFKNEQLPYVMEALKIGYGFDYEITGSNVTIAKYNIKK